MRFTSLGSGSKGNCLLLESGDTCVMIDCGFTAKEALSRIARIGFDAANIDAILVTHEHGDHIKGVPVLAKRLNIPVYATFGTAAWQELYRQPFFQAVHLNARFSIGGLEIDPVAVPHDAREPCQYVVSDGQKCFGILTDLGSITPFVLQRYQHCDALFLECNHDEQMLAEGPYPPSLKRRVGGDWGHLSNRQAAALLNDLDLDRLQHVVLAHLSEQNNTPDLAMAALSEVLVGRDILVSADQVQGSQWLAVQ